MEQNLLLIFIYDMIPQLLVSAKFSHACHGFNYNLSAVIMQPGTHAGEGAHSLSPVPASTGATPLAQAGKMTKEQEKIVSVPVQSSLEAQILSKHQNDLQSALVEPTPLASSLFQDHFISSDLRSRVTEVGSGLSKRDKAAAIFEAVEKKIGSVKNKEELSETFLSLLSILKQHVPIDSVAMEMEKEYMNAVEEHKKTTEAHEKTTEEQPKERIPSSPNSLSFHFSKKKTAQNPTNWKFTFLYTSDCSDPKSDEVD